MNEIRLGNDKAYEINSDKLKLGLLDQIKKKWKISIDSFKKDCDLLKRSNINRLRKSEYCLQVNTYSIKYLLYFTIYKNKKYIVMFNIKNEKVVVLKNKFFTTTIDQYDKLFNETLIKAELTKNSEDNKWYLLANDCLIKNGIDIRTINLTDRLKYIYKFETIFKNKFSNFYFQVNYITSCSSLKYLCSNVIPKSNFKITSIIFVSKFSIFSTRNLIFYLENKNKINDEKTEISNYIKTSYTDNNKLKTKSKTKLKTKLKLATFQINLTSKPDVYQLYNYDSDNKFLINFGIAYIVDIEHSFNILKIFSKIKPTLIKGESELYELKTNMLCKYNEKFDRWMPISLSDEDIINSNHL